MEYIQTAIWAISMSLAIVLSTYIASNILAKRAKSISIDQKNRKADIYFSDEQGDLDTSLVLPATDESVNSSKIIKHIDDESYFKFSNKLERSVIDKPEGVRRRLRFRIGLADRQIKIYNVQLLAYFVITRTYKHENNTGWGSNWPALRINKDYLPELSDYWTISHLIDEEVENSPILENLNDNILDIGVVVFAVGQLIDGKVAFGKKRYGWNKTDTVFGTAKLKKLGQNELPEDSFDEIIPQTDKYDWPNLQ